MLVRRERTAQDMTSQPALAARAKISPRKISDVERGIAAGPKTYDAIERALRWPEGSMSGYLDGGPAPKAVGSSRVEPVHEWSADERRKILAMPLDDVITFGQQIKRTSGERAAVLWLHEAMRLKAEAAAVEPEDAPR